MIKQNTTPTEDPRDLAKKIEGQAEQINLAVETILFDYEDASPIHPDDIGILRLAGIADNTTLDRERGRIGAVKRWFLKAGTQQEYDEATRSLKTATEQDEKLRPQLEEQLATLQQQLNKLGDDQQNATRIVESFDQAREHLSNERLLPEFIRDQINQSNLLAGDGIKSRIAQADSRVRTIDAVLQLGHSSDQAVSHAETAAPHLVQSGGSYDQRSIESTAWEGYQQQLSVERVQVAKELEDLKAELHERLGYSRKLARFYLDQIPQS